MKSLKIALTVNAAWNVWNFRRPLVEALIGDGHDVVVVSPEDDSATKLKHLGCRFIPIKMDEAGLNPFNDFGLLNRLHNVFHTLKPDVILGFTIKNNLYGAIAARHAGIPFIPNVTGLGTAFLSGGPLRFAAETLYRIAFADLPVVFFQNDDDQQLFINRGLTASGQSRLLPGSGINLQAFAATPYPSEAAGIKFLMISRILRDKGVFEYADAARKVRQGHPTAKFQLLGSIDTRNRTAIGQATVDGWRESHSVDYLGTSEDVRIEIASAHCIVLPSYREGAPRTLIEAAAMARPVIATDVAGCRSVVDDGSTGLLCAPRDANSLASACIKLMTRTREEREEMGRLGRLKMMREFDEAIVIAAYRDAIMAVTA